MDNEILYIKGFNAGYFFKKYEPVLSSILPKISGNNNIFLEGIKEGVKEFDKEHLLVKLNSANKDKGLNFEQ